MGTEPGSEGNQSRDTERAPHNRGCSGGIVSCSEWAILHFMLNQYIIDSVNLSQPMVHKTSGASRCLMQISKSFNLRTDDQAKLEIVLSIYSAMVAYVHELREAVERLTVWGCGLMLLATGWLVTSDGPVTPEARAVISTGVFGFAGLLILIIRNLRNRFDGYAKVIRRINEVQLAHEHGVFLEDDALLPRSWRDFGEPEWKEPIFWIAYVSLCVVGSFSVIAVCFLAPK